MSNSRYLENMEYIQSYRGTNIEEIREVEKLLKINLHAEYVNFLLSTNGGIPKRRVFYFFNKYEGKTSLERIKIAFTDKIGDY